MFKLPENNTVTVKWPVKVRVPKDGGGNQIRTFDAKIRILPIEEAKALKEDEPDFAVIEKSVEGWDGVVDANDQPVEFSPETLKAVCEIPFVRLAVIEAIFEASMGGKRKN